MNTPDEKAFCLPSLLAPPPPGRLNLPPAHGRTLSGAGLKGLRAGAGGDGRPQPHTASAAALTSLPSRGLSSLPAPLTLSVARLSLSFAPLLSSGPLAPVSCTRRDTCDNRCAGRWVREALWRPGQVPGLGPQSQLSPTGCVTLGQRHQASGSAAPSVKWMQEQSPCPWDLEGSQQPEAWAVTSKALGMWQVFSNCFLSLLGGRGQWEGHRRQVTEPPPAGCGAGAQLSHPLQWG